MKTEFVVTIIVALFLALTALIQAAGYHFIALVVFLYTLILSGAAVQINNERASTRIKKSLAERRYQPLYRHAVGYLLPRARRMFGVAEPSEDARDVWSLWRATLSYRLLDRALLLAVIYPLFLLLLYWVLSGRDGVLGNTVVVPAVDARWKGYATLGLIALLLGTKFYEKWAAASPKRFMRSVSGWLDVAAIILVGVSILLLDLGPVAFAVAVALAVALAVAGAFAGAGPFAGAGAFAGAFAVSVNWLYERHRPISASLLAVTAPIIAIAAAIVFIPWIEIGDRTNIITAVFLFLAVAPLINALFDAVSYSVTLALTERGAQGLAIWFAAIDVVIALVLFLALGATFVCIVSWMNVVAGVEFIDLGSLLAQAGDTSRYWWLYAMLFSTALPTLIHLSVATLSLQAFLPPSWRERMRQGIVSARGGDLQAGIVATIALGTTWFMALFLPLAILGGFGWAMWNHGLGWLAVHYRDMLIEVAIRVQGI